VRHAPPTRAGAQAELPEEYRTTVGNGKAFINPAALLCCQGSCASTMSTIVMWAALPLRARISISSGISEKENEVKNRWTELWSTIVAGSLALALSTAGAVAAETATSASSATSARPAAKPDAKAANKTPPASAAGVATTPSARIELFNGKDLHSWKFVAKDTNTNPETVWKTVWTVRDGVIHFAGEPKINLQTLAAYRDYQLHVEWRWPEGRGNSGVFLHVTGKDRLVPVCVEAQLLSTRAGDLLIDGGAILTSNPKVKGLQVVRRREESSEKALGQWNAYDIMCRGNAITVRVNGVLQNEVEGASAPSGAPLSSGYIALQAEGKAIEFRNIWIEPLAKP
jgi:hypothetical protein